MASIFPGSASVGQIFEGYLFNGTAWDLIGNEFNPTSFSPNAPDNPKAGDLWVDSDSNVPSISNETILTIASASATYATKAELSNIDALPSQNGNAGKYLTTSGSVASWGTIDLTSAINTASAAAVTYLVDSAPATLDTLNELAAALGDDANFASTVTTSLGNKLNASTASSTYLTQASGLTQASASTTYLSKNEASSTYLTSASMQTVPVYVMNSGSSAQRPVSPSAGMFRFNTDSGYPEWYDSITSNWYNFYQGKSTTLEYVVIAGGGGANVGGAGAGGYRSSVIGENTGGGLAAESLFGSLIGTNYTVTVGAGGAGGAGSAAGSDSVFGTITSIGGGDSNNVGVNPTGGSGGGQNNTSTNPVGAGTAGQGFAGALGATDTSTNNNAGGGGGGGAVGGAATNARGGNGGVGVASNITGTSVTRAGGGSGGGFTTGGTGGTGGGGNGSNNAGTGQTAGGVNTGGGGGGLSSAGGSGVVILRYSSAYTITIGAGLTGTTTAVGANSVTTFTAGTGTVTFN